MKAKKKTENSKKRKSNNIKDKLIYYIDSQIIKKTIKKNQIPVRNFD